jgi:GNAT superfamily N-acetyltransferase
MASVETDAGPCELLDWDSEHFGFPVGRVVGETLTPPRADEIDEWCLERRIRCLYLTTDSGDADSAGTAARHGYRVVDIRVIGRRPLDDVDQLPPAPEGVVFREAIEPDFDYLRELAARSHRGSRFYFDGEFPPERCDALYSAWIDRGLSDPNRTVYVPVVDGEPAGYQVLAPLDARREGHGELVAIDGRHQGRGVGMAMRVASLRLMASRGALTQLGTCSAGNVPMVRQNERLGFLTEKVQTWHHKWYDGPTAR